MKKIVLLVITLAGMLTARAGEYSFLTFVTTNGEKASVPVESLELTVNGSTLVAGDKSFAISNLSKMYFSDSNESSSSGVNAITLTESDEIMAVYDLNGKKIARNKMLPSGAYIVVLKDKTCKIVVK